MKTRRYLFPLLITTLAAASPVAPALAQDFDADAIFDGVQNEEESLGTVARSGALKVGDRLDITVLGFPDLSGEYTVAADGSIQIPLVGYVSVAGIAPARLVNYLSEAFTPYVRRPQVVVSLMELSPLRVSVTGAVVQPGPRLLNFDLDNTDNKITLSEALVIAGGITPEADLRKVTIRRPQAQGHREMLVDLWEVIQTGDLSADPEILDGDEVVVPKATAATSIDQRTLLASTVAPVEIIVHVAGEVDRPGQLTITPNADINAAVAAAGGFTEDADPDEVVLYRMEPSGQLAQRTFEFGDASTTLMQGDLIVVKRSTQGGIGDAFDFVGRILDPVGGLFRILENISDLTDNNNDDNDDN